MEVLNKLQNAVKLVHKIIIVKEFNYTDLLNALQEQEVVREFK